MTDEKIEAVQLQEANATADVQSTIDPMVGILDDVDLAMVQVQPMISGANMTVKLVEDTVDYSTDHFSFATRLQQVINYKDEYGNFDVPMNYSLQPGLGEWLHEQKELFRRWLNGETDVMNDEDRMVLIELGVVGFPTPIMHSATASAQIHNIASSGDAMTAGGKWEARLQQLRAFKEAHGHCNVTRSSKHTPEYNSLGEFVHFQRRQFKYHMAGKVNTLTQERIQSLDELGFEWSRRGPANTEVASLTVNEGSGTKRTRSRSAVPTEGGPEPTRKKRNALTATDANDPDKKLRLKEGVWQENLEKVNSFKQRFGHCNVPRKWSENIKLGEWVHFQRRQYSLWTRGLKNHMTEERIQSLTSLGFEWTRNLSRSRSSDNGVEQVIVDDDVEEHSVEPIVAAGDDKLIEDSHDSTHI